jgi:integrase
MGSIFFQEKRNSMSVYSVKGKGWRYDFTLNGQRYTEAWFSTKRQAKEAESKKQEEVLRPQPIAIAEAKTPQADMVFREFVGRWLDYIKEYKSSGYYHSCLTLACGWIKRWQKTPCSQITRKSVKDYALQRKKVSAYTANKEIRHLKAAFNYGVKEKWFDDNPAKGIDLFPMEKKLRYIPPLEDINKVISCADPDTQNYLMTIRDTMARVSEVNRLTWDDVDLVKRHVVLYTRKKRGGHLTPRKVGMTDRLHEILTRRFAERNPSYPWVFWHVYKTGDKPVGPFKDRRKIIKSLCDKAGVRHFRFHALRHSGASLMDNANVPIGPIQKILGHENRTTTEIYLYSIGELEREAIAIFERSSSMNLTAESLTQTLTQQAKRVQV